MPKLRIFNVTSLQKPPGRFLDFNRHFMPPNPHRPIIVDIPVIPTILHEWVAAGWIKVQEADDKLPVSPPAAVTPGTRINEAVASELSEDDMEDDIVDFKIAKEAELTSIPEATGPLALQPTNQMKAKVTLGERDPGGLASSLSPIPGDKPTSIDKSEAFTVKAPRSSEHGAVVKSG